MDVWKFEFQIENKEAGQRGPYQDSHYHYLVTTDASEDQTKEFCMHVLRPSYEKAKMPNPFAGELIEFKKVTDNRGDKPFFEKVHETYSYKTRECYTG